MQTIEKKRVVSRETSAGQSQKAVNNHAKQLAEDALATLAAALENGQSEALVNYLAVMARFRSYSANNCLLISMQRPNASRVAGFHSWRKLGRHVRKGAKGIAILAPMVCKKAAEDSVTEDEQTRIFGFRTAYVFAEEDTEGADLPQFATVSGDPRDYAERLSQFITAGGITLEYSDRIAPAKGLSQDGAIVLLPGMSPAETLSVLAHETAHELLHKGVRRSETIRTVRETEAEAVAFVVCHGIGLETGSAAADYIQLYRGDKATLLESLQFIQSTAIQILTGLGAGEGGSRQAETL